MRKTIIGLLLLVSGASFGQTDLLVLHNEKVVGKNLIDNTDIQGIEFTFPERIHETYLDTTNGFLTAQLRGLSKNGKWLDNTGVIVQYDLKNRMLLWNKKISYQYSSFQQFSNTMILTAGNKSSCLDVRTGSEIWEVKNNIYFVDPTDHIGIGYRFKSSTGYSNELEGIDLNNGHVIWKREINREYGWNDVFYTNDSTMIVVASGLHSVNIHSGQGWDYHTITGKKDYTGTVAANAAGAALGILTGTFVMSTGHDLVRDLVSNCLVDSISIYFASKEQLVKIDKHSGELVWMFPFPDGLASKSSIFMKDSIVFMVNKGMAFMGYRQLDFGRPFFAAFNKQTGKQIFLSLIIADEDPILSYQIKNKEIFLVFKSRIAKHSMETGDLMVEKDLPVDNVGELKYFVGDQVFITDQDGDLLSLSQSDSTSVFVFTSEGKTLCLDSDLTLTKAIDYADLSINYLNTKNCRFIAKDNKTLILSNSGQKIAEIEASSDSVLIGNVLYSTQGNRFCAIDLHNIIDNE
jgi:outer membrane protein assembly factor BamB